jgi:hypothetical protein
MKGDKKVPKTILEDIIIETLSKLKKTSEFDESTLKEFEVILKDNDSNPDDIINVLKESIK